MAKLSALTAGNVVNIPFLGVGNVKARFLQYNHYSKSEAALYIPHTGDFLMSSMRFPTYIGPFTSTAYDESPFPMWLSNLKWMLPDEIRGSLINVPIICAKVKTPLVISTYGTQNLSGTFPTYESFTANASVFFPSVKELGYTTGNMLIDYGTNYADPTGNQTVSAIQQPTGTTFSFYGTANSMIQSGIFCIPSYGSVFSYLSSNPLSQTFMNVITRDQLSFFTGANPRSLKAGVVTSLGIALGAGAKLTQDSTSVRAPQRVTGPGTTAVISGELVFWGASPILTLDGRVEVTGSATNYTISKAAAVETYRKIDGVWYRTV